MTEHIGAVDLQNPASPENGSAQARYLNRLFIMSYPFSQGVPQIQGEIFKYIHAARPDIQVDEKVFAQLDDLSYAAVGKYFKSMLMEDMDGSRNIIHNPYHVAEDESVEPITYENIKTIVHDELVNFRDILNGKGDSAFSIIDLTTRILERDYQYLMLKKGRARVFVRESGTSAPLVDPWFSYYCHYSLLGKSTGLAEFDQLTRDIKQTVEENPADLSVLARRVVRKYNKKHPQTQITLPPLAAKRSSQ